MPKHSNVFHICSNVSFRRQFFRGNRQQQNIRCYKLYRPASIVHYLGVHVPARRAASFLVDTFPSDRRQFRTSGSVRQQVIPTCEDHTNTGSSASTKQWPSHQ